MNVTAALKGQYHAAMAMLQQAIEECPADLWNGCPHSVPFWQVVYHTLYTTHMYLQPHLDAFQPWKNHRPDHNDLPWPPECAPTGIQPYAKSEMLEYWRLCEETIDQAVDALDLSADSGFPWHKGIPKLDHQMMSIRHVQHHTAILAARLRQANGTDIRWVRRNNEMYVP